MVSPYHPDPRTVLTDLVAVVQLLFAASAVFHAEEAG
jgi:hypothetical protein